MNPGPYHLIPIGILLILIYLGSFFSVRLLLLDPSRHRRFWNLILLLFFISSALLGLFLSIKVNYKLNIPSIDRIMQWHVDLGIGLAFVAVFHLTWHLGYYKKMLSLARATKMERADNLRSYLDFTPRQTDLLFALIGFFAMVTQMVLLREYLKTLHGNELVISLFLASWMVLTAAGARAGTLYRARIGTSTLMGLILLLAALPVLVLLSLIGITRLILLPGFVPGILSSWVHMTLIVPVTLLSGFLFSYLIRAIRHDRTGTRFYMLDSMGSLTGGLLFGLGLVFFLNNIQVAALLFILTASILALFFHYPARILPRLSILFTGSLVLGVLLIPGTTPWLEGIRFRGERILDTRDTPYGNLTFSDRQGLITGYLDRNPVISSHETTVCEERVHYPSLQRPGPASFLLLGGGVTGVAEEILKYNPETFDYCEPNRWFYSLEKTYLPSGSSPRYVKKDARSWMSGTGRPDYDVVISAAGEPLTLGWNRFFTEEFFRLVKGCLTPGGIFSFHLPAAGSYINETGSNQLGIAYHTLIKVFPHVILVPGQSTYFVASDMPLSLDFPSLLIQSGIPTSYVHSDYIDASRLAFESDLLLERIPEEPVRINRDLWPVLFFSSLTAWDLKTGDNKLIYIALVSLFIFLLLLFTYSRPQAAMFVTGFSGAGMQLLFIMAMQSYYGFAYLATPLMFSLFMGGIVTGTLARRPEWRLPSISRSTMLMGIMALVGAAAVVLLNQEPLFARQWSGMLLFGTLNFLPGLVVGSVYRVLLTHHEKERNQHAGVLFSADLAGAALGSLVPPLFLLPLIGVSNTIILLIAINVAVGLYVQTGLKRGRQGWIKGAF
jgi:predicted membrane-bound spermidine synthase